MPRKFASVPKYSAEIRQIIDEMLPLRSSRQQTVDYYNRKLIADIRLQARLHLEHLALVEVELDLPKCLRRYEKKAEVEEL